MARPPSRPGLQAPPPAVSTKADLHVAIIMDGNGRWARRRAMPRTLGHRAGVSALRRTVESAPELGISCLTVFGFSTENWSRPHSEVTELMRLLKAYVESDLDRLVKEGVKVQILGRRAGLSTDIQTIIERAEDRTRENDRFLLQVAFNYGGQADIVDAARRFARDVALGLANPDELDEGTFERYLSSAKASHPDLIIRTSGEQRLSNFLLWESAYAELVFQDVLWPDYGPDHLTAALREFNARERRFGGAPVDEALAAG